MSNRNTKEGPRIEGALFNCMGENLIPFMQIHENKFELLYRGPVNKDLMRTCLF